MPLFPGRCHARSWFHAVRKGTHGPQLAVGVLGTRNTRVFRRYSPGNVPTGAEAFPELFLHAAALPKAGTADSVVPSQQQIALYTWNNTGVFLHMALRHTTRTLFSFSRC